MSEAETNIKMIITLQDSELYEHELHEDTQALVNNPMFKEFTEDTASLMTSEQAPEGAKAFGGFLLGMLGAEVSRENLGKVFKFLGDRLGDEQLKMQIETPDGRKLNLEANSKAEFDFLYEKAKDWANTSTEVKE
ncbi:MAG: sugar ABC transporter permease [Moorea sp. SIO2B7]|nr:sugar ABC transporter permease [Moorena sp. SIO2B7]